MKEMCVRITPYRCPNCNNDLLFFTRKHNNSIIDYKGLIDNYYGINDIKEYLYPKDIKYLKCIACGKLYIINWSDGYPVPLLDKKTLNKFGLKG